MCRVTGSSQETLPASTSMPSRADVNAFVVEPTAKIVFAVTGSALARFADAIAPGEDDAVVADDRHRESGRVPGLDCLGGVGVETAERPLLGSPRRGEQGGEARRPPDGQADGRGGGLSWGPSGFREWYTGSYAIVAISYRRVREPGSADPCMRALPALRLSPFVPHYMDMTTTATLTLPPTTHVPRPYEGPTRAEVLADRRRFTNPAIITYYATR